MVVYLFFSSYSTKEIAERQGGGRMGGGGERGKEDKSPFVGGCIKYAMFALDSGANDISYGAQYGISTTTFV